MHQFAAVLFALAGMSASGLHAQASPSDVDKWWTSLNEALTAAPQHHELLFEKEQVRVRS